MSEIFTPPVLLDDGLPVTAAEPWIRRKVDIIQKYVSAFVGMLAGKVNDIVVVDLFAGSGLFSLGARREVFPGHGFATLGQDFPVTKVILCEKDPEQLKTLKIRVGRMFRARNTVLLEGRPEELIDKFKLYVPQSKGDYKAAVLCICDPFSLELPFAVIDQLSLLGFSFVMPFTFSLNERIDYRHYFRDGRDKVKKFLGGYRDIDRLERDASSNAQFYRKLVRIYENNILALGLNASNSVHRLDSGLMEMPAYYIGFFSRQYSTRSIQEEVMGASQVQYDLFTREG